jgi:adenylosuccinate lyase
VIERYARPEMDRLWTSEYRYETWLRVELLVCEAWGRLGVIPEPALSDIRLLARVNMGRIRELEPALEHEVLAFTTSVGEQVGPSARFFHYGLTSSDVIDTALGVVLTQACEQLIDGAKKLAGVLAEKARKYKFTPIVGRTHGQHAEPTTLGLKLALWYAEMQRNIERLRRTRETVRVGKLSGAVGTFSHVSPEVERYVCQQLGLEPAPISSQILQRDRHAEYATVLAIVAGTLEKIALEIRNLQRTELREVEEPFQKGQKGSSAMPHKRNPVRCERISGLARLVRTYAFAVLENQALWHERDLTQSSVERVALPDATILLDYMMHSLSDLIGDLQVYPETMEANLKKTGGLIFSGDVLLGLVNRGLEREEAYAIVQEMAMAAWQEGKMTFHDHVLKHERIRALFGEGEIEALFDPAGAFKRVGEIFARVGLE